MPVSPVLHSRPQIRFGNNAGESPEKRADRVFQTAQHRRGDPGATDAFIEAILSAPQEGAKKLLASLEPWQKALLEKHVMPGMAEKGKDNYIEQLRQLNEILNDAGESEITEGATVEGKKLRNQIKTTNNPDAHTSVPLIQRINKQALTFVGVIAASVAIGLGAFGVMTFTGNSSISNNGNPTSISADNTLRNAYSDLLAKWPQYFGQNLDPELLTHAQNSMQFVEAFQSPLAQDRRISAVDGIAYVKPHADLTLDVANGIGFVDYGGPDHNRQRSQSSNTAYLRADNGIIGFNGLCSPTYGSFTLFLQSPENSTGNVWHINVPYGNLNIHMPYGSEDDWKRNIANVGTEEELLILTHKDTGNIVYLTRNMLDEFQQPGVNAEEEKTASVINIIYPGS